MQLLAPTQPLGTASAPPQFAKLSSADEEEDEDGNEGIINILSIVGFIAALVVLSFQIMTANTWVNADDNAKKGDWMQLMQ